MAESRAEKVRLSMYRSRMGWLTSQGGDFRAKCYREIDEYLQRSRDRGWRDSRGDYAEDKAITLAFEYLLRKGQLLPK